MRGVPVRFNPVTPYPAMTAAILVVSPRLVPCGGGVGVMLGELERVADAATGTALAEALGAHREALATFVAVAGRNGMLDPLWEESAQQVCRTWDDVRTCWWLHFGESAPSVGPDALP